jgi:hypothetical protein
MACPGGLIKALNPRIYRMPLGMWHILTGLFVQQQHSAPAVWWGKPFRILLAESKICIATCSTKDEGMGDFENITVRSVFTCF